MSAVFNRVLFPCFEVCQDFIFLRGTILSSIIKKLCFLLVHCRALVFLGTWSQGMAKDLLDFIFRNQYSLVF